jgi:LysM repeat protein
MEPNTCSGWEAQMAIAPLGESPRRRAGQAPLHLVKGGRPIEAPARRSARHARTELPIGVPDVPVELVRSRAAHPTARPVRAGGVLADDGRNRRAAARGSATLARRRAVSLGLVAVVAVVLLSLPLRSLAAVTVDGQVTPTASPTGLVPGSVYVVHAGDTLRSIARRVQGSDVANIERRLALSVGSSVLVPGEHVDIP